MAVATLLTGCYENRSCYRQCNERFSMSYVVGGLRKNSYCPLHFSAGLIRLLNTKLGFWFLRLPISKGNERNNSTLP